ncbi:outer membrane beta-barrel protein [Rufibacter ruber]|uniref:outer membrane beta-barrel protein n=1 Tax=Rufibacter ruber TaxID=1783499 RepID=UPI000829D478|nr:outer membrane beta-barrel protein [Rufibacter ruber]
MKSPLLPLLFFLLSFTYARAQGVAVTGTVSSALYKETLVGATVQLVRLPDSVRTAVGTDKEGNFRFPAVSPGTYAVLVNYLGHSPLSKAVQVQQTPVHLGQLVLQQGATLLQEVQVVGQVPPGTQKGDTTVFNAAAFKVADDASAEDLVTKLPGVTITDGKVQAQGEDVRQVLVDGKRFFGEDANTALRNLPAEVIENIEIFDKKSDQAEFSGFDDGNRAKTINIVTKKNRRTGQFGKVAAAVGPDKKYMAGASVNFFKGERRFTVNGLLNNINLQDFSVGEAPGGGMRGAGAAAVAGGAGITTTNTLGFNYTDLWGKKIEVSGNYNYSNNRNENNRFVFRDYLNSQYYEQENRDNSFNTNREENHQFNFRFDYKPNDRNRLLIRPRITVQRNDTYSTLVSRSVYDSNPDNEAYDQALLTTRDNSSNQEALSYNLSNDLDFSHRFNKPGRTITLGLNTIKTFTDGDNYQLTNVTDYLQPQKSNYLNQHIQTDRNGFTWRGNVALGEQVGPKARVQASYSISNRQEDSERLAYDWEENAYTHLNTRLSNAFESEYLRQQGKATYLYNSDKLRVQLETVYQNANLQNQQEFPAPYQMDRTFHNFLPGAQLEYKFSKTKNLQLDYSTNVDAPSVTQLQEVVDNTNPLRFRVGNAGLVQEYRNTVNVRYRSFNLETNRVFTFFVNAARTDDYITNSTTETNLESEPLLAGLNPGTGAQLIRPVNLDGSWSTRAFMSFGQPVSFIKSNVSVNGSVGYNKTPGLFNREQFFSTSTNYGLGVSLSSNISENVDFNASTRSNYNVITSTLRNRNNNNNFFTQNSSLRANLKFWRGVIYRTELSHQYNAGLSGGINPHITLLNMSLSKRVFKSQKGEISLSVNDVLGQNVSVSRTLSDAFVQDVQSTVLQRFFLLTFSYNIRSFNGAAPGERDRTRTRRTPAEGIDQSSPASPRPKRQGGGRRN